MLYNGFNRSYIEFLFLFFFRFFKLSSKIISLFLLSEKLVSNEFLSNSSSSFKLGAYFILTVINIDRLIIIIITNYHICNLTIYHSNISFYDIKLEF